MEIDTPSRSPAGSPTLTATSRASGTTDPRRRSRISPRSACAILLFASGVSCGTDGAAGDAGQGPRADLALPAGGAGRIEFLVTDDLSGQPLPSRVLFTAVPPTTAPRFDRDLAGKPTNGDFGTAVAPGVLGSPEGVLLVSGSALIDIAIGTYDLFITHGPEWEADTRRITVEPGQTTRVAAPLRHSVDTGGWMSADLHVHTLRSFDSRIDITSRAVSEVSVGVDIIVTTDHQIFTDLQPGLDSLGYHDLARALVGDEFNFLEGHGGAYPVPYDGAQMDGGCTKLGLNWEVVRLIHSTQLFATLHGLSTRPVVTVNHPRLLPDLGYFTNIGWSPPMALPDAGSFDSMEVLTGYESAPGQVASLLRDWFFILNAGTRLTALGASDTHKLRDVRAGFPRSWLMMPTEKPAEVTGDDLAAAIRGGRVLASNGPFAVLKVEGRPIGDLVTHTGGPVMVDAFVDAPAWIDVDKVRFFVNGRVALEKDVTPGKRPLYQERLSLPMPAGDAWIALQVGGKVPLRQDLVGEHGAGKALPFAITNPVYIDGDGDGVYRSPFARLVDADPGPLGPLSLRPDDPEAAGPDPFELDMGRGGHGEVPQDCEPPLWTDPSTWVNP